MNDDDAPELFALYQEDKFIVDRLIELVRILIQRSDTTAREIHHLSKLLLALQRLPLPTKNICIHLALGVRFPNNESNHLGLELSSERLCLDSAEFVIYDRTIGGDSIGRTYLEVEVGTFRDGCDRDVLEGYLLDFGMRASDPSQRIEIEDMMDDSQLDWETDFDEDYWKQLESEFYGSDDF